LRVFSRVVWRFAWLAQVPQVAWLPVAQLPAAWLPAAWLPAARLAQVARRALCELFGLSLKNRKQGGGKILAVKVYLGAPTSILKATAVDLIYSPGIPHLHCKTYGTPELGGTG